jgi:protein O-GlcNAc transferase
LPEASFVFCVSNSSYKLNPIMFDIWCRVLIAVPGSVLWIVGPNAGAAANLLREASTRGVPSERVVFADRLPYAEHLARIANADLFLDTLPFNGGTTVSDFLWVGVPVLTCAGASFAGRMAGSLLGALDLSELITFELQEYEHRALALANDPPRLRQLRARLAAARSRAAVFDTRRHCRALETAYREIWARYERGEQPATIRA